MATNIANIVEILEAHPELVGNKSWKITGEDYDTLTMLDGQPKPSVTDIKAKQANVSTDLRDLRKKADVIENVISEVGYRHIFQALNDVDGILPNPQGENLQMLINKIKQAYARLE